MCDWKREGFFVIGWIILVLVVIGIFSILLLWGWSGGVDWKEFYFLKVYLIILYWSLMNKI